MRFAVPTEQLILWLLAVPVVVAILLSSVALARRRRAREAFADGQLMDRLAPGASHARARASTLWSRAALVNRAARRLRRGAAAEC